MTGFSYLKKYWHWGLLLGSLLLYIIRYIPPAYLNDLNSDTLIPVVFYQDIVQQGHSFQGWSWGGASFLFPDLILIWILNFVLQDGLLALQAGYVLFLLGWIVLLLTVYRVSGGKRTDLFAAFMVLLAIWMIFKTNVDGKICGSLFITFYHGGGVLIALACLALTQRTLTPGFKPAFWLINLLLLLGAASDALLMITFTAPILLALALFAFRYPAQLRLCVILGGNILLSSAIGLLLVSHIFSVPLASGYTQIGLEPALDSVQALWSSLDFSNNYFRSSLFVLDVVTIFLCGWTLMPYVPWNRARTLSPAFFFLIAYGGLLIMSNWGGAILTGNYIGTATTRYVAFALICPLILLGGCLSELIRWPRWATSLLFVVVSISTLPATLFPPQLSGYYADCLTLKPLLQSLMAEEHMEAGLGNYWYANSLTYLSHQTIPVRNINKEGCTDRWFNNLAWVTGDGPPQAQPTFRFIIMSHLNAQAIRAHYGAPARIIHAPSLIDIWVYSPEDAIRYHPIFGYLGNRLTFSGANQFHTDAANLPSQTGIVENGSRIARAGRDKENCMSYGPYLRPIPGRYRVDFSYAYEAPPSPDKTPVFDCVLQTSHGFQQLDTAVLSFSDTAPKTLTREIVVPTQESGKDLLETRIFYHGSGDLRLNSLTITYLEK